MNDTTFPDAGLPTVDVGGVNFFELWDLSATQPLTAARAGGTPAPALAAVHAKAVPLAPGFRPYAWATPSSEVASRHGVPLETVLRYDQNTPPLPGVPQVPLAESMARLATLVGQPGYEMAVEAERDICAIKAGMKLAKNADLADMKALGVIEGALRMGAGLLSGGTV